MPEEGYQRHNLYTGAYSDSETAVFYPDTKSRWQVLRAREDYNGADELELYETGAEGPICLLLNDDANTFWPIISFLSSEEARTLAFQLIYHAGVLDGETRTQESQERDTTDRRDEAS